MRELTKKDSDWLCSKERASRFTDNPQRKTSQCPVMSCFHLKRETNIPCRASTVHNKHQPLQMSELPEGPWQNVSVDFCGLFPSRDYHLVVLDEYSTFPFVDNTINISTLSQSIIGQNIFHSRHFRNNEV